MSRMQRPLLKMVIVATFADERIHLILVVADEKKVKQAIQQSCGFEKVNGAVKKSMRNWVAQAMWGHEH